MNGLYEQMWLYYNLFQPVLHLHEKQVQPDGIVRRWDTAQTPYQRLLASGKLSAEQQARLQALYEQTNPLRLRQEIYQDLAALWHPAPDHTRTERRSSASVTFLFEGTILVR